ncbi:MAG TPA: hypothetical protein VFF06_23750 [Polyangia bacterium]|nr:hypothetical protein [Polyangia bacterium]
MSFEPDDLDVDDETAPFARFPGACDADQHLAEQHEHLLAAALAFGRLARRELASAAELEQARLQLLYAATQYHGASTIASSVPCLLRPGRPRAS